ncbi:MAG TPA: YegS/Rv2252/BmrU family lipid kinase [Gemmatimonadales bacterium]|nr:YegS/Rv2252/BmrU family lipid kinase [Gemmatimonadales bacterium]
MTDALIVTNPAAARAGKRGLAEARRRLEARGFRVEVETTVATGDGERLARAAAAGGTHVVIAHGGDGTVMDVAAGLVGTGLPLGLLPGGTGNVLAGNLGISRSFVAAAETIAAGTTRTIDVGRLTTGAGSRYFAVNCAAGFAADLMAETEQHHKRQFGVAAYVARAFVMAAHLVRAATRVEVDGAVHEGQAVTVLVANCRHIVPRLLPLAGDIAPDDGMLDVAVLDAGSYAAALRLVWRLVQRRPEVDAGITFYRGRRVRVSSEPELPVEADGEALGTTPMLVELLPRSLTVFAPLPRHLAGAGDDR